MEAVKVKSLERMQHLVVTDRHALIADEPPPDWDGLGPNLLRQAQDGAYEFLLAALGS